MIREWRGFMARIHWDSMVDGTRSTCSNIHPSPSEVVGEVVQLRVIARVEGEPDGLPVGSMSNKGKVVGIPYQGFNESWFQPTQGASNGHRVGDLKSAPEPTPEPKKYAVVVEGFENKEDAENYVDWAENFSNARVVDASTLGEGGSTGQEGGS